MHEQQQQHLTWQDMDEDPVLSLPAHRLEDEPYRKARKVWFWLLVAALALTGSEARTWRGWEFTLGRALLPVCLLYVVGYAAYSVWDRIAWRFQLGRRRRDSAGERWVIDD